MKRRLQPQFFLSDREEELREELRLSRFFLRAVIIAVVFILSLVAAGYILAHGEEIDKGVERHINQLTQ